MSRRDIGRWFDAIVEFAGVTEFLDIPLKRSSAGMQLRLAFAVAAHLEPDIVLVDEILAVRDVEFQERCIGRISELGRDGGPWSPLGHDLGAIRSLCDHFVARPVQAFVDRKADTPPGRGHAGSAGGRGLGYRSGHRAPRRSGQ